MLRSPASPRVVVTWSSLAGKPATFPPSPHTHAWADITDRPTIPAGNTLIGTVTLAQSAQLIGIQLGIKDLTVDLPGAVVGDRYQPFIRKFKLNGAASYTNGRPAGYAAIDAACNVAGKVTVSHNTPAIALLGGSYELVCDIVKINT